MRNARELLRSPCRAPSDFPYHQHFLEEAPVTHSTSGAARSPRPRTILRSLLGYRGAMVGATLACTAVAALIDRRQRRQAIGCERAE